MNDARRLALATFAGGALALSGAAFLGCGDSREHPFVDETGAGGPPDSSADADVPAEDATVVDSGAPLPELTDEPVVCAVSPCAVELVAGAEHFCARLSDGTVRCWGAEGMYGRYEGALGRGELDVGADAGKAITAVVGVTTAKQLSSRLSTTCALLEDGSVKCWGTNYFGELGVSNSPDELVNYDPHPTPSTVPLDERATWISRNDDATCAVLVSGEVHCWGYYSGVGRDLGVDADGFELAVGRPGRALIDVPVSRIDGVLALTRDGHVYSWGLSPALGRETSRPAGALPGPLVGISGATSVGSGPSLIAEGELYRWGYGANYGLCLGPTTDAMFYPARVAIGHRASNTYPQQVSAGWANTCVRMTDGTVQCCGSNQKGQLGAPSGKTDGGITAAPVLQTVPGLGGHVVQVAVASRTTCALQKTGAVECWGGNEQGQLGRGTNDDEVHPMPAKVIF